MVNNKYQNAFKEVYEILQNTEDELVKKIPNSFINFLKDNMNIEYQTNISTDISIDKQKLLPETEAILSLIYKSYWATDEEMLEFAKKDKQELQQIELEKRKQYGDIDKIFKKNQNITNSDIHNELIVQSKENFIRSFFKKFLKFFRYR